jgi:hypothetical protein
MTLKVICAWCGLLMKEGTAGAPTSHGLCPKCEAKLLAEMEP